MRKPKLNPSIVSLLSERVGKKESTIKKDISILGLDYPTSTPNAVAQIYARQHHTTVRRKLTKEDVNTLPEFRLMEQNQIIIKSKPKKSNERIPKFIEYETDDFFIKAHIREINLAYAKKCFTCVYILARKIIENLIIDIMKNKFPPTNITNKHLYFDDNRKRYRDFSEVLENLYRKRTDFGNENIKLVKRLHDEAKKLKGGANDHAHSWYFIAETKTEIDNLKIQTIIELIRSLQKAISN